jgi:hypothetical protein
VSVKDKLKAMGVADKARTLGVKPEPIDDGPDVSGLNDAPKDDMPALLKAVGDPTGPVGAGLQKWAQGASFNTSDELSGLMSATDETHHALRQKLGLEDEPEKLADPLTGEPPPEKSILRRFAEAYRKGRGQQRDALKEASAAQPGISTGAEVLGAVMAPAPKMAALPAGASRLQRMGRAGLAAAPVGAAFGLGGSEADITEGEVGGAIRDTVIGGGVAAGTGAAFGGLLHGPLSKLEGKEREAIEKAEKMARESLDAPERSARGALGGVVQAGHRDLEVAQGAQSDALADPAISKALADFAASPEGIALRNRVLKSKAESLPGKLSEIDAKQAAFDAARAANTPEAIEREAQRILGPERFKEATMMRAKKYAGRVAPPFIGSAIGGAIGGPEGAMGGALAGSIASAALGSPGTALANYMRDPSVMLRMSQAGQSPATMQLPAKATAEAVTSDDDLRQRILEYLKGMGK